MIYVDLQQSTFYIVLFKSLLKTQVYPTHTSSLSTFDSSEGLCGAHFCRVRRKAAHRCAAAVMVEAAGLGVVLRETPHSLGSRGHGVGGGVHVALLLY